MKRSTLNTSNTLKSLFKPAIYALLVILLTIYLFTHWDDFSKSISSIRDAQIKPILQAVFWTALTYFMSSLVVMGASTKKLSYVRTVNMSLASVIVGRFTPKGVGSAVYMEQYLETNKLGRAQASASTSLVYSAGIVVHLFLTLIYALALNPDLLNKISVDGRTLILAGITIVGAVALLVKIKYLEQIKNRLELGIKKSLSTLRTIAGNPYKLFQIFAGSAGVTICYALAFYYSAEAFGSMLQLKEMILIYLGAGIIASAAPTPGGLGAVEAALSAGLVTAGMSLTQALSTVAVFRLITFWLPIVPGMVALRFTSFKSSH